MPRIDACFESPTSALLRPHTDARQGPMIGATRTLLRDWSAALDEFDQDQDPFELYHCEAVRRRRLFFRL